MYYTVPPTAAPPPRPRPAVVTIASYLLYLIAALQLLSIFATLAIMGTVIDVYNEAYQGTEQEGVGTIAGAIGFGIAAVLNLIFAGGFATLGILVGKGKNAARIVTWVVAAVAVCCFGVGLGGAWLGNLGGGTATGDGPTSAELQQRVMEALPSWYDPYTFTVNLLALLAAIGAIILLALPASNEFFRKPEPTWGPPPPYPPMGPIG